jgi:branched-chain amino acid transport system permease protein
LAGRRNMRVTIPRLRGGLIPFAAVVVVLAVLPALGVPSEWLLYLFLFFIYLALANMWNLLAGYSGLICLCPAAFTGLAGYTVAICTWVGLPFYLGIICGAIVAAVFALLISFPVFRLRGIYFAIGTLVLPEVLKAWFLLWRPVGGSMVGRGAGYAVKGVAGVSLVDWYWVALVIGMASIFLMRIILSSKLGQGLAAIRDNDETAASSGIDVFRLKLYSFVIGAIIMGIAGAVFYTYSGYIEPVGAFNIRWLLVALLGTVIGGEGIREGPIIGAAIVVILHFLLARYAGISLLIQGALLIIIMLLAPQGIVGYIKKTRTYRLLSKLATG